MDKEEGILIPKALFSDPKYKPMYFLEKMAYAYILNQREMNLAVVGIKGQELADFLGVTENEANQVLSGLIRKGYIDDMGVRDGYPRMWLLQIKR
ncbi:hypothetical protein [Megasphaera sp.]|uniref:hypothetical protein n=1 Tax=Megasphaera sp. TaxID=2023260 RepID=UPI004029CD19